MENKKIEIKSDSDYILSFARNIIESIYASVLDYKSLIDSNWHYLYCPREEWAKFCKINIFLLSVRQYIVNQLGDISKIKSDGYYHDLAYAIKQKRLDITTIATTNYNVFIHEVLNEKICYLNGSTNIWYDPYVNRLGRKEDLLKNEEHFIVPLIFTQSGTKPMTSIEMSKQYVNMYDNFKKSDKICVVGFGFNKDDEHINGILRTLIDIDNKKIIIVDIQQKDKNINDFKENIVNRLKIFKEENLEIILVDYDRRVEDVSWLERLLSV